MSRQLILFTLALSLMLQPVAAIAQEARVVRYHTAHWIGITNRDGTGLYNEILERIYGNHGYTVERTFYPVKRALLNVKTGEADITGGSNKADPGQVAATHPIWIGRNCALFHRQHLPSWEGVDTIAANLKKTVSSYGMGRLLGMDIYEVPTRNQALSMILTDRMIYYVDTHQTLTKLLAGDESIIGFEEGSPPSSTGKVDLSQYVMQDIAFNPAYMIFPDTERGRRLRDIFDTEFMKLHRSGELAEIYEKWGLLDVMPTELTD